MAREKTVFGSHANLAHVWAQQKMPHGRSSDGRMLFEGETIYSYGSHFPIARFVTLDKGRKSERTCVLFTTRSYSSSTGAHKNYTRRALRGDLPVFEVKDPRTMPQPKETGAAYRAELKDMVASFLRSTPHDVEVVLRGIETWIGGANEFSAFFRLGWRLKMPEIPAEALAKVQARTVKKREREALKVEQRRVAYAVQDARTRAEYRVMGKHHAWRTQEWGFAATLTAEDHAAHDVAYAALMADEIARWRAGEHIAFSYDSQPATMLRVQGDEVQTSMGASFPITHARRAFPLVKRCRDTGQVWEKNGHSIHLGQFAIDRIEADGTVRAGCHVVAWDEIAACARALGLYDESKETE